VESGYRQPGIFRRQKQFCLLFSRILSCPEGHPGLETASG